jgi:hypothetical protein
LFTKLIIFYTKCPVATEEEGRHHTDLVLLDIRAETIVLQQQQQPKAKSLWRSGAKPANHFIESL